MRKERGERKQRQDKSFRLVKVGTKVVNCRGENSKGRDVEGGEKKVAADEVRGE